jgi:hypothetical protein
LLALPRAKSCDAITGCEIYTRTYCSASVACAACISADSASEDRGTITASVSSGAMMKQKKPLDERLLLMHAKGNW